LLQDIMKGIWKAAGRPTKEWDLARRAEPSPEKSLVTLF
jgi:hypothetical protein